MIDNLPIPGACLTSACLAIGWLDQHHAAATVLIAAITGAATVAASIHSIYRAHRNEQNTKR